MKSILLIVLSLVAISTALPQFNQGGGNRGSPNQQQQQQGFPNTVGNQNPFLPGNQGFGVLEGFDGQQQGFAGQQQQQPGFNGQQNGFGGQQQQQPGNGAQQTGFGGQQQQQPGNGGQQTGSGGQQGLNNTNQPQGSATTVAPGVSSVVGTPQYVLCNQNCPSVNQYNPICGTDQVTYNNQYRLDCANDCGRELDPNWQEITIVSRRNCVSGSRVA